MTRSLFTDLLLQLRQKSGIAEAAGLEDAQLLERYLTSRDEGAFAMLVRRHGPMVLGVCQRILSNAHDCEDAFQATFLVLLRKARSLRKKELLANWLYGVAHRTALNARSQSARRREYQRNILEPPATTDFLDETARRDLRSMLDEELSRLPAKYRAPVVLCYLEGKTFAEAAVQLGWPAGTVSGRLARARAMLRRLLTRRDAAISAGWEAFMLQPASPAVLPASLVNSTLKMAASFAAGSGAAAIPGPVAVLSEGVIKAMFLTKVKILATVAAIGVTVASSGVLVSATMASKTGLQTEQAPPGSRAADEAPALVRQPQKAFVSPFDDKAAMQAVLQNLDTFPGEAIERARMILNSSTTSNNLKPIVLSLFEAANLETRGRRGQFLAGQGTQDIYLGSSLRLLEAERLLNKEKEHQMAALMHHRDRMAEIENVNKARYEAGRIPVQDFAQSRFYRIQAELWIEQAETAK
jgi:RNA polymerase sigma factor (sigma-70 family)